MPTEYNIKKIQLPNGDICNLPDHVKYIDIVKTGNDYSLPSGVTYASIKSLLNDGYVCVLKTPIDDGYEYYYNVGDFSYINDGAEITELSFCTYNDKNEAIKYIRIGPPAYLYLTSVSSNSPGVFRVFTVS